MRVLVCGSRTWANARVIITRLDQLPDGAAIIEGGAPGADSIAGAYANSRGLPHVMVPANWTMYGKAAGPIRNGWMLDLQPNLVIAFQHNSSRGTQNTIDQARQRGIPVEIHEEPL